MPNTMTLISSVTLGSGGASFMDFSSIPQTYTDLLLRVSARSASGVAIGSEGIKLEINNTTTNFSNKQLYGTTSSTGGGGGTSNYTGANLITSVGLTSAFNSTDYYFSNYTSGNYKPFLTDSVLDNDSASSWELDLNGNLWSSNSAINQLTLKTLTGSNFVQYSTAYLYGIKNS